MSKKRKKSSGKNSISMNRYPTRIICMIYSILLLLIYPFVVHNSYLDILETKTHFFLWITVPFLLIFVRCFVYEEIKHGDKQGIKETSLGKKNIPRGIFSLMFLAGIILSMALAENRADCWTGTDAKMMGARIFLLCLLMSLCLSMSSGLFRLWAPLITISGIFMGILTIMNRFGQDPLHMYPAISESQYDEFLGTIGQINIVSGFFCVIFPLVAGLYLMDPEQNPSGHIGKNEKKNLIIRKTIFAMAVMISAMAGICSNSDSFFIGMAATVIFLFYFALQDKKHLASFGELLALLGATILLLNGMNRATGREIPWRELQLNIVTSLTLPILLIVLSFIFSYLGRSNLLKAYAGAKCQKIYLILIGMAAIILLGALIYINRFMEDTSAVSHYLVLDDFWGTNRMYIWKRALQEFGKLPTIKKVCGIGSGNFSTLLMDYYPEEMYLFGYYFVDAHNEMIQFLVEYGILGFIGYFGMIIHAILACIREWKEKHAAGRVAISAMLTAWIFQGVFNNPTVIVTPFLFYFVGVAENRDVF